MDFTDAAEPSMAERVTHQLGRKYQHLLDRSTIYTRTRWAAFVAILLIYSIRVYLAQGWYIISYGLGIYLLNKFIGFLSPQVDPDVDGPVLPTDNSEEFRPFNRRIPEFKFWYSSTKAVLIAIFLTCFRTFDIPVFWPILLIYWFALFFLTMKRQILHMIKHRYVPWTWGKARYTGKEPLNVPGPAKQNK